MDPKEIKDNQALQVQLAVPDLLDLSETPVQPERLEIQVLLEEKVHLGHLVSKVHKD
jgi:hypothetical protein